METIKFKMKNLLGLAIALLSLRFGLCYYKKDDSGLSYRGRFMGKCRGDGLYYRDSYSFVTCTHSIAYKQPCPPGTRNKQYQAYSSHVDPHFCTENLVNIGYTVYNKHPLHGPRSSRKKPRRYMDRQRGYSTGRIHRPFRRHWNRWRRRRPQQNFVYRRRPEGRMYTGRVERNFFGHQRKEDLINHHTGPEFHGPYRDQAKNTAMTEGNQQAEEYESHTLTEPHKEYNTKTKLREGRGDSTDRNDISSGLEHPLLTFHQKSRRTNTEPHQVRLIKPQESESYNAESQDQTAAQRSWKYSEPGRSVQPVHKEHLAQQENENDEERAITYNHQRQNRPRHSYYRPNSDPKESRLRLDLTRIKLIPPGNERPTEEERQLNQPREPVHGQGRGPKPDFQSPRYLAELKRQILEKYRKAQRQHFRTPVYDQYSRRKDRHNAYETEQRVETNKPGAYREQRRDFGTHYRPKYFLRPEVVNDRSTNGDDDDDVEKLLLTIVGVGDKIISYKKSDELDRPSATHKSKRKKKRQYYNWRSHTYKKKEG